MYVNIQLRFWHTLTFVCSGQACGISLPCNGGVVCDSEEAPRDELERKESREGQSLNPTWAAAKDAAFSGWDCPPSARRSTGGGEAGEVVGQGKKKVTDKGRKWIQGQWHTNPIHCEHQSTGCRRWLRFILTLSRSSLHTLSGWKWSTTPAGQRGTHNQIKTLQDTMQINRFSDFTVYSRFTSHWKPGRNLSFPLQHCRFFFL